jgi:hypothetical protein
LGKLHCKAASAEVAPELLAEQELDVSLIVNHENKQAHARPPDLAADHELTEPITYIVGRSRAMNSKDEAPPRGANGPVTTRTAKISNREECAEHHSHAPCRDEAPRLGFKVTFDRQR